MGPESVFDLHDQGWSVIPVRANKEPMIRWGAYQQERPTRQQIEHWLHDLDPTLWGGVTGQISGRLTLDFDGAKGEQTLRRLDLPAHRRTPGQGFHTDFWAPAHRVPTVNGKTKKALGEAFPGLDIRADGGFIALLGSNTKGPYQWLTDDGPMAVEMLPLELRSLLHLDPPAAVAEGTSLVPGPRPTPAHRGDDDVMATLVQRALVQSVDGRNDAGFWLACQLRDHGVVWDDAVMAMTVFMGEVADTNPRGHLEPYTLQEVMASLEQAFGREAREPYLAGDFEGISITHRQLGALVDESIVALVDANDPPWLFRRGGQLVRLNRFTGSPRIEALNQHAVGGALAVATDWFKIDSFGEPVPTFPPMRVANTILNQAELPFPALEGVIAAPTLRADGTVLTEPGFDDASGLYLEYGADLVVPPIPDQPTPEQVEAARQLLMDEMLGEFPFADEGSRANAVGLAITPCLRSAIQGLVPMATIDAPAAGTGKSHLTSAISMVAAGRPAAFTTPPDQNNEELRKRLTSLLIAGESFVVFDNVAGTVNSPVLSQLLTAEVWSDRILGVSKMATVPQRAVWCLTGNNIALGGDLPRRCYPIRLDAKLAHPWQRAFSRPDLLGWVQENRGELLAAVLTLARAWFSAGCPAAQIEAKPWGTFHEWKRVIGGILKHAGVTGFLDNLSEVQHRGDDDAQRWYGVLSMWRAEFGDTPVRARELLRELDLHQDEVELPARLANSLAQAQDDQARAARLANQLRQLKYRRFDDAGLRLEVGGDDPASKTKLWVIRTDGPHQPVPPVPSPHDQVDLVTSTTVRSR